MWNSSLYAKIKKEQTPFYHYNLSLLKDTLDKLNHETNKYGYNVHYALKANADDKILNIICNYNIGCFNCESEEEIVVINNLAKKLNKKA